MATIALLGAGGKMGCRIADNLKNSPQDRMLCVEVSEPGLERLRQRGLSATPRDEAIATADAVILALPDNLIATIAAEIVPRLKPGAMVIGLDPAVPHAGKLPRREDICYFFTHPCHPSVFNDETDPEARRDRFGGSRARQNIVCALLQGTDADYERGEAIARVMYAPVIKSHRLTVAQMALLEPALVETLSATCLTIVREGLDEVVRRGVPAEAARDFLLGHIQIELAILFGEIGSPFSDGALKAIGRAKSQLFQPDWKKVFEPENLRASVEEITRAPDANPACQGGAR